MKRLLLLLLILSGPCTMDAQAGLRGARTPSLVATADRTTVAPGETITITYEATNATSCQYAINQWGNVAGWSDGIVVPLSGTITITPAEVGQYNLCIVAFNRKRDLNHDFKADGHRHSYTVTIPITVTAPSFPPPGPFPQPTGSLTFTPSTIKAGEPTTRSWTSTMGKVYLDGQRVPASGSDTLWPTQTLKSVLQITKSRWSEAQYQATVTVTP